MLKCCSLYSGSSGNSFLVQTEKTKLLVDCGVSCKKIENALKQLSIVPNDIDAILITHEHIDHTKSLGSLSTKYNIPIYINPKTWMAVRSANEKLSNAKIHLFNNDEQFKLNDLIVFPFSTPHDAADPCGFSISKDGKKISIATDLGHITDEIMTNLKNSSLLLLESNYDSNILQYSSYPYMLKKRIAGPNGHLENCITGKTIAHLIPFGLEKALLIHLSRENNFPDLAYKTVTEELEKLNFNNSQISLEIAPHDFPSKFLSIN